MPGVGKPSSRSLDALDPRKLMKGSEGDEAERAVGRPQEVAGGAQQGPQGFEGACVELLGPFQGGDVVVGQGVAQARSGGVYRLGATQVHGAGGSIGEEYQRQIAQLTRSRCWGRTGLGNEGVVSVGDELDQRAVLGEGSGDSVDDFFGAR
jgi:hypothetical protein